MPNFIRNSFLLILLLLSVASFAQNQVKDTTDFIHILYADHAITDRHYPDKQLLSGEVKIEHNGAFLYCDKAIVDKIKNSAIAVGNVRLEQGDTITMRSGYLKYDGTKSFAQAFDHVVLKDSKMDLATDTLYYDRVKQEAYFTSGGVIHDSINTLESRYGRYYLNEKRFRFTQNVHITNPDYQIDSYQLDYFTQTGVSIFSGPTKIYNKKSYIYAEKGHYDSKNEVSWFVKNAFIKHKHTSIKGDSLYYDRRLDYATGNDNVVVFDSINRTWIYADYVQRWVKQDSIKVSQNPLVISINKKDTLYMRATRFITSGKEKHQKVWGFDNVKFYNKDFTGRADSIYRQEDIRLMKLLNNPVVWSNKSQITGDKIIIKSDSLNQADSLRIPKNVFIIQKDSLGYNQIKGNRLLGKFKDNAIDHINIYGNTEIIYYLREEDGQLTGIEKNKSSRIYIQFNDGEIGSIGLYEKPDGIIYPANDFPASQHKLKGFKWLGKLRIKSKEDVIGNHILTFEPERIQKNIPDTDAIKREKLFDE